MIFAATTWRGIRNDFYHAHYPREHKRYTGQLANSWGTKMLIWTEADFEKPGCFYCNPGSPPGVPAGYRRYPFFADRLAMLKRRFAPDNQKLLIVGCGYGYLVDLALQAGYDAWGCDISPWAVARAQRVLPAASAARVLLGDATSSTSLAAVKTAAGLKDDQKFAVLMTEDMLGCLTDGEIALALPALRAICSSKLLHLATPLDPSAEQDSRLNWKTGLEWKELVAPDVFVNQNGRQL